MEMIRHDAPRDELDAVKFRRPANHLHEIIAYVFGEKEYLMGDATHQVVIGIRFGDAIV